jgi:hypothetical protein
MLNRLTPTEGLSTRSFSDRRFEKSRRVIRALDEIPTKHGRDAVHLGAACLGLV